MLVEDFPSVVEQYVRFSRAGGGGRTLLRSGDDAEYWSDTYLVVIALDRYLSLFAERVAITPLPFVLALAATWLLACLAVGACAWRAAKLHPAEALRQ